MLVPVKVLELIDYMKLPRTDAQPRDTRLGDRTFTASKDLTLFADYEHRVMFIGRRKVPFEQVHWWDDEVDPEWAFREGDAGAGEPFGTMRVSATKDLGNGTGPSVANEDAGSPRPSKPAFDSPTVGQAPSTIGHPSAHGRRKR